MSLSDDLHKAADSLSALEGHGWHDAWAAVVQELYAGNPKWSQDTGKNAIDSARDELRRLYAVDAMVTKALQGSAGEKSS